MNSAVRLNGIDLTILAVSMVLSVALGFLVSRRGRASAQAYFLGGKTLPWYVVATSMVAADVSAEHFIANAGVAYRYGIVPATGSWNTWIIYSLCLWIFLPARMGVVGAGFLHVVTPFFFTVPGIVAFALYPKLPRGDAAYLTLVQNLIPTGLRGLILAAMAAALMSNLSSVLNSASTLVTIDFYRKFFRPAATETQQVRCGQVSGTLILLLGIAIALIYSTEKDPLFVQVQRVFFFIAPPFAVIFTLGLLWRRANATAAVTTVALGFPFAAFLTLYAFPHWALLKPYNTYQHPALVAWGFCMAVMIAASLATAAPPPDKTTGIIWSAQYAALPPEQLRRYSGLKDWRLWWLLFVATVLSIYAFCLWFRLQYPMKMLP